MFSGTWKESSTSLATFPDHSAESFDLLIDWVYSGTIRTLTIKTDAGFTVNYWNPVRFYQLADKLCIPELQDKIIDFWRETDLTLNIISHPDRFGDVYKLTPVGSPLRRYAQQTMAWLLLAFSETPAHLNSKYEPLFTKYPEFLTEFLSTIRGTVGTPPKDPRKLPKCDFHIHDRDVPCSYST